MTNSLARISAICIGIDANDIAHTLNSMIGIREELLEIIIIDSSEKEFLKSDHKLADKITLIRQYPPRGISNAFNKGVEIATGEYIVFFNAGDQCLPKGFHEGVQKLLQNPKLQIITGPVILNYKTMQRIWRPRYRNSKATQIHHIGTIYNRRLHDSCGPYDPHMKCAMDYSFLRRALKECQTHQIKIIDEPISIFEMGGVSSRLSNERRLEVLASDILIDAEIARPVIKFILSRIKGRARKLKRRQFQIKDY